MQSPKSQKTTVGETHKIYEHFVEINLNLRKGFKFIASHDGWSEKEKGSQAIFFIRIVTFFLILICDLKRSPLGESFNENLNWVVDDSWDEVGLEILMIFLWWSGLLWVCWAKKELSLILSRVWIWKILWNISLPFGT